MGTKTHVPHVDGLAWVGASGGIVGEGVRCDGGDNTSIVSSAGSAGSTGTSRRGTTVSTSAIAAEATAAPAKASTTAVAASEATTAAEATAATVTEAATAAHSGASETILANLKLAALPVVAVELLNRIPGVVWVLKHDDA